MRRRLILCAVILLVASALPVIVSQGVEPNSDPVSRVEIPLHTTDFSDYIWPTDAGSVITSTFAEYRRMHFHGGIDIGTGNDTGFLVFASRDGYVSRISVSPTGYGKMLFVRHSDGFFTTYAHLRNFSKAIDDRVSKAQLETGSYPVDIRCEPHDFPVKKGEVIAYTGETGVGTPHLHFEIRDPNNNFINPLQCAGFPNSDTIVPTVRKIAVTPIGSSSLVDGSWEVATYTPKSSGAGRLYEIPAPIHITGEAGFAIDVRDRSQGTHYRQGIHSHRLFVDDSLMYTVELDRAPSEKSHQSGLYFDWSLSDAGLGRFHRLYSTLPNDLWFYSPRTDSAGILGLSQLGEGPHSFRIVSTDRGGNSTVVSGKLVVHRPPRIHISNTGDLIRILFEPSDGVRYAHISTRGTKGKSSLTRTLAESGNPLEVDSRGVDFISVVAEDSWGARSHPSVYRLRGSKGGPASVEVRHELADGFVRIHVRTEGTLEGEPVVTLHEGLGKRLLPVSTIDTDHFVAAFVPDDSIAGLRQVIAEAKSAAGMVSGFHEFEIYPIRAGSAGTYLIDDESFLISYDPESVLNTTFVEITKGLFNGRTSYTLEPINTVLDHGVIVGMRVDSSLSKDATGLFAHSRRGWTLLAARNEPGARMLTGKMTQTLGEVSIVTDNVPPSISSVNIRQQRQAYPVISFRFDDGFAGIEYNELKMYIDDQPVVPEVDGEHQRAVYQRTEPLAKGTHLLKIQIKDKLGNQREFTRKFTVR